MIKQAIIPLAGLGTRLLPLTSVFAKELLPINGKPGIQYILDECIEAGIKEDDIKSLDKILNNCEMAQYSPLSSSDAQYSYDQSQLLFNQFEKDVV